VRPEGGLPFVIGLLSVHTIMQIVGIVEIIAGVIVAVAPRLRA